MRCLVNRWLGRRGLAAAALVALASLGEPLSARASEGFESLVQLIKSGTDEKTLLEYVDASPATYALTEDEILYLSDLGVSGDTIKAIVAHGQDPGAVTDAEALLEQVEAEGPPPGPDDESVPSADMPVEAPSADDTPAEDVVEELPEAPPVVTAPAPDAVDYTTFYTGLAPYGTWLEMDGDWYWQPTAVRIVPRWSPYCHRGRWVYSDCGWVWKSSYSWGWAPFHYGRWRHHARYGWIWRPGRVWGPAWVCWRFSDRAIGWAPLPPTATYDVRSGLCYRGRPVSATFEFGLSWVTYTFVPIERFCEPRPSRHRFSRSRIVPAFLDASRVQNRVEFQGGRVCNIGPAPAQIVAVTHQELRPLTVVDLTPLSGAPIPRPTLGGSTVGFYRPPVAPTVRVTPRQVVTRREPRERDRDTGRHDEVFHVDRPARTVQGEEVRGRESRAQPRRSVTVTAPVTAPAEPPRREVPRVTDDTARPPRQTEDAARPPRQVDENARRQRPPDDTARLQRQAEETARLQRQAEEAARQQRQADEAAARRQEEQRRRTEDLIRARDRERQLAQEAARQQAQAEQQQRAAEFARQQEAQRQANEVARQRAAQRQQEEANRRQELQQQAEAAAREAEARRQALRAQREAEEAAARQQEAQAQNRRSTTVVAPPPAASQSPTEGLPGYGTPSVTGAASSRGANSRESSRRWRER